MNAWGEELAAVAMAKHARAYARRGWRVLPIWWCADACVCACPQGVDCHSPAKHPLVSGGVAAATADESTVVEWWGKWPFANIAIATGADSGFFVLDVDGDAGHDSLGRLFWKHARPGPTNVAMTGSGRHILWRHPGVRVPNKVALAQGLDVRGDGGYIVAPPSLHNSGVRYAWHESGHPGKVRLDDAPAWVVGMLQEPKRERREYDPGKPKPQTDIDAIEAITEGGRNRALFQLGCRLRWEGLDDNELADALDRINRTKCQPPLGDREVHKITDSVCRYPQG